MLLSAFMHRNDLPLNELSQKVIQDGRKNITNAKEIFLEKLEKIGRGTIICRSF